MINCELPPGYRLTASNQQAINKHRDPSGFAQRRAFSDQLAKDREIAIERWYRKGGYWFIKWVKRNYRRQDGQPLHWKEPYQLEFYLLMGTPWITRVICCKGAQVGFTECLTAIAAFSVVDIRVPTGLGFEQERKLQKMAPRVQACFDQIEPVQTARLARRQMTGRQDTDDKQSTLSVAGVELHLFYANTKGSANSDEPVAPSSLRSAPMWVALGDEIELWGPWGLGMVLERQGACEMATKPFRAGSTPGHEGGIVDSEVRNSGYVFYWSIECPHCGGRQFLHPFGNFLKSIKVKQDDGSIEEEFIDSTGRPIEWFCHDASDREARINSAYLGCQSCGQELGRGALSAGYFVCQNTGIRLKELCDQAIKTQTAVHKAVALYLPRLASVLFDPAERLRKMLTSRNPGDQIQQGLGVAVTIGSGRISLKRLSSCVGLPLPPDLAKPDLVVLGVDQGKAHNWGMIQNWYLGKTGEAEQQWVEARVEVVWWGAVIGFDGVDRLVEQYGVDLVGIDNEPEVQLAAAYAKKHLPEPETKGQVFLFDQVTLKGEDFRRTTRTIQNIEVPMFALHRTFGLDSVRHRIYRGLQHFPAGLIYDPTDEANLLYHYLTSDRRDNGVWEKTQGAPDHLFHADNFCSAAVLVHLFENPATLMFARSERKY